MNEANKAVFLSYASQDAEAAKRICEALRAAGLEVWFDQNELVGGDAWDQKIRRQIRECALFLPIISLHTQKRSKGCFRLEWKLAVDQRYLLAAGVPFVAPVVIDDTKESVAVVPPDFTKMQWTRPARQSFCAGRNGHIAAGHRQSTETRRRAICGRRPRFVSSWSSIPATVRRR